MMLFGIWCLVCLFGSTDLAGELRVAVQTAVMGVFGVHENSAEVSAAMLATGIQKAPHVLFFGLLGWLAAAEANPVRRKWCLTIGALICIAAEVLQGMTATRSLRLDDAVLNLAVFGLGAWLATRRTKLATEAPDHRDH